MQSDSVKIGELKQLRIVNVSARLMTVLLGFVVIVGATMLSIGLKEKVIGNFRGAAVPARRLGATFYVSQVIGSSTETALVVPAGETWIMDASVDVPYVHVMGNLTWDVAKADLELRAAYILVDHGGHFQVGTADYPMEKNATIYIKNDTTIISSVTGETRNIQGIGVSKILLHGRKIQTWSMLSKDAPAGTTELYLRDDPTAMGWQVGDEIGIATTSAPGGSGDNSSRNVITGIGPATQWKLVPSDVSASVEHPEWSETSDNAIDGHDTTRWVSAYPTDGVSHWLQVGLSAESVLTMLTVTFAASHYPRQFSVTALGADGLWSSPVPATLAADSTNTLGSFVTASVQIPDMTATAVRISGADFSSQSQPWMVIYHVTFFGREVGADTPTVVYLKTPLPVSYWGGFRTIGTKQFELAAEVGNLARSVTITGDHATFETDLHGWTSRMSGMPLGSALPTQLGVWDQRYVRMEYCGQRQVIGKYCLHFHVLRHCPSCAAVGNAIVDSQQIGVTIHATHDALVDRNVLWDVRGNGIYTEAGNELNNTISNNLVVCESVAKCSVDVAPASPGIGAIYLIGMSNHLIGNHLVGYDNGIYSQGSAMPNGAWPATGRVCPKHAPFGVIRGNVEHDCGRYCLYLDYQFPRNLIRDDEGYVTDMSSCEAFTADGKDNGVTPANVVEDEFNWHCHHVGQYDMGDVSYVRYTSVNNFHGMYWKKSKNFADGVSHHIRDSVFAQDPSDFGFLQLLGPAGPFLFKLENVSFHGEQNGGCGAVCAGQHCGLSSHNYGVHGSLCNVEYNLSKVDFSDMTGTNAVKVAFGASGGNPITPVFLSQDGSLGTYSSLGSQYLNGLADVPECEKTSGTDYSGGYGCSVALRRMSIWGPDMGNLTLSGKGYGGDPDLTWPTVGQDAGILVYDHLAGGYGSVPVFPGEAYALKGLWRSDGVLIQFSDVAHGVDTEQISLTIGSATCTLTNSAPGSFQTYTSGAKPGSDSSTAPGPCADAVKQAVASFGVGTALTITGARASEGDASLVMDGKQPTTWTCASSPCELELTLASRSEVSAVFVAWSTEAANFSLSVQDLDGYVTVQLPAVPSTPVPGQSLLEQLPLTGSLVKKIKLTFSTFTGILGVREIYAFGTKFDPWDKDSAQAFFTEVDYYGAGNVVDGDLSTRWGSNGFDNSLPERWWSCNFNAVYQLNRVIVRWEGAYAQNYDVQVRVGNSDWSIVYQKAGTAGLGAHDDSISLNAVLADGLKIVSTLDATVYGLSIYEVDVGGTIVITETQTSTTMTTTTPAFRAIQLLPTSVKAGYTQGGFVATNAIDGDRGTRWASGGGTDGQFWWSAEFQGLYRVGQVSIVWENAYATQYVVQLWDSSCSWINAATVDKSSNNNDWDIVPLTGSGYGIKMTAITVVNPAWGISLFEVQVMAVLLNDPTGQSCAGSEPEPEAEPEPQSGAALEVPLDASSATASFEQAPFYASTAVDNDLGTRFASAGFEAGTTISWEVSFAGNGDNYLVSSVQITWETAYCKDYTLQLFESSTGMWTKCVSIVDFVGSNGGVDTITTGCVGQGLRILCDTPNTQWGMSFYEVKAIGAVVKSELIALSSADASASYEEIQGGVVVFPAGGAVDGNQGTRWGSNGASDPSGTIWWSVTFPGYYRVDSVRILWEGAYASEYQLQLRSCSWSDVTVGKSDGPGWVNVPVGAAGDGLKIIGTVEATAWRLSIIEVEVYGYVFTSPAC